MFKGSSIFIFLLLTLVNSQFDNLNELIRNEVRNTLRGNIGGFGGSFNGPFGGAQDLGSKIQAQVAQSLAPLHNLGDSIRADVEKSLMPMRAKDFKHKMMNGIGGVTIVYYNGNQPKKFLVKSGRTYECIGAISNTEPRCLGTSQRFQIKSRNDFCYAKQYVTVDNYLCIAPNDHSQLSFSAVNGRYKCENEDETSPPLFISQYEFKQMCGNRLPWENVLYKYYSNPNDPFHVEIPNNNPYIKCMNNEAGICVFNDIPEGNSAAFMLTSQ